jgi:hypothetical protein
VNEVELQLHYGVCTIVLTDMQIYITLSAPRPVISLI